jgi:hypothetical protein
MPRKKKQQEPTPASDYQQFIQGLEIVNVVLASADMKRIAIPGEGKLGFEAEGLEIQIFRAPDGFGCRMPLQFQLYEESEDTQRVVFAEINVAFEGWYRTHVEATDEYLATFQQVNLKMNLWPYIREFVHSHTQAMGFPPLLIPHLKAV